jgi:hypothetical protein
MPQCVTNHAPKISSVVEKKCAPEYGAFHLVEEEF